LFYPEPVWAISVSNPRRRLKTGGAGELWVLGVAIALLCFGIYLANGGGITQKVSQNLGLKDGVVELYNQNASTHQVYANITGYWSSDRTSADGKYLIIGNEGNEFIVSDGKGVYKTGEQIITSKVSTEVGEAAKTEIKNISFDDEEAIALLEELQQTYPGAARFGYEDSHPFAQAYPLGKAAAAEIYLSGELTIDFPEDVKIPVEPNQMVTASVVGSSLKLNYCGLEKAIAFLKDQYAVGTVEIKVVQAKPFN
jgi:inner membrane protein